MEKGVKIINTKTNSSHTLDGIEEINGEILVFTEDMKCFPISEIQVVKNPSQEYHTNQKNFRLDHSIFEMLINDFPDIDKKHLPKSLFIRIWEKVVFVFFPKNEITSSND